MKNNSKNDVFNHIQKDSKRIEYLQDNISACLDVGYLRKNQEDSLILANHPKDSKVKILALADGMGGLSSGEIASNIAIMELYNWFSKNSVDFLHSTSCLKSIDKIINDIDELIRKNCNGGGTTLSCSIVFDDFSYLLNIGDSRIYTLNNQELIQMTNDYSIPWLDYQKGIINDKNSIRFHKKNNLILSRLGCLKKMYNLEKLVIENKTYSDLFLFSDGVTDCVSDEELLKLIQINKYTANNIVDFALNNISYNSDLNSEIYYNIINGGKDNTSAIVLTKKR